MRVKLPMCIMGPSDRRNMVPVRLLLRSPAPPGRHNHSEGRFDVRIQISNRPRVAIFFIFRAADAPAINVAFAFRELCSGRNVCQEIMQLIGDDYRLFVLHTYRCASDAGSIPIEPCPERRGMTMAERRK
jgi:hypothetical protein